MRDKIDSLIGFAIKAGKVIYGGDTFESSRKRCYLIVMCRTTADNTQKKVLYTASEKNIPVIFSEKPLQDAVGRNNCKVIAVTDKQMAQAMIKHTNENYRLYSSEVK